MGWTAVDKKLKNKIFSFFVVCDEVWEMDFMKEVILDEIPFLNDSELTRAMMECCKEMAPPRPRSEYLKKLRQKLELQKVVI